MVNTQTLHIHATRYITVPELHSIPWSPQLAYLAHHRLNHVCVRALCGRPHKHIPHHKMHAQPRVAVRHLTKRPVPASTPACGPDKLPARHLDSVHTVYTRDHLGSTPSTHEQQRARTHTYVQHLHAGSTSSTQHHSQAK